LSVLNGKTQFAQKCQGINMRTLKKSLNEEIQQLVDT